MKVKGGGEEEKKLFFLHWTEMADWMKGGGGLVFSVEHIKKFFFTKEPFIRE